MGMWKKLQRIRAHNLTINMFGRSKHQIIKSIFTNKIISYYFQNQQRKNSAGKVKKMIKNNASVEDIKINRHGMARSCRLVGFTNAFTSAHSRILPSTSLIVVARRAFCRIWTFVCWLTPLVNTDVLKILSNDAASSSSFLCWQLNKYRHFVAQEFRIEFAPKHNYFNCIWPSSRRRQYALSIHQ